MSPGLTIGRKPHGGRTPCRARGADGSCPSASWPIPVLGSHPGIDAGRCQRRCRRTGCSTRSAVCRPLATAFCSVRFRCAKGLRTEPPMAESAYSRLFLSARVSKSASSRGGAVQESPRLDTKNAASFLTRLCSQSSPSSMAIRMPNRLVLSLTSALQAALPRGRTSRRDYRISVGRLLRGFCPRGRSIAPTAIAGIPPAPRGGLSGLLFHVDL